MRHRNSRYAFIVSSPLDLRHGYGTAAAVLGLMESLHRKGKKVGLVQPTPVPLPQRWKSWWFNLHVPRSLSDLDVDCVVGIDYDGYRYARSKSRRPFISLLHGVKADELLWETGGSRSRLQRSAHWEALAAKSADLVVAPSAYACRRACEEYGLDPSRTRVVPNGLRLEDWKVLPPGGGPPRVVTAARMIRRKGLEDLVRIWPRVRERVQGAQLDIAGDGPLRGHLEGLAHEGGEAESICFHGVLSPEGFRGLLAHARVFCLPSRQEAFGLVLLEAMACGRPVVATRAAAIPEVVGEAGILVEPGSPKALADALVRVLSDPSLQQDLARTGRARAEQFSWEHAAAVFGAVAAEA